MAVLQMATFTMRISRLLNSEHLKGEGVADVIARQIVGAEAHQPTEAEVATIITTVVEVVLILWQVGMVVEIILPLSVHVPEIITGVGGRALSSASGTKIFAGGGGGAGHFNNNPTTHGGGDGGGIIIVIAKNIIGNGYKITANGQSRWKRQFRWRIWWWCRWYYYYECHQFIIQAHLLLKLNGGNGGTTDNQNITNRCYGAGGGGSSGVLFISKGLSQQ